MYSDIIKQVENNSYLKHECYLIMIIAAITGLLESLSMIAICSYMQNVCMDNSNCTKDTVRCEVLIFMAIMAH